MTCQGYIERGCQPAVHQLHRNGLTRGAAERHVRLHVGTRQPEREHHRRLHQDREAGRRRRLDGRHDGDPEPGHRRAEPARRPLRRIRRRTPSSASSACATTAAAACPIWRDASTRGTGGRTRCTTRARAASATSRTTAPMNMGGVMQYISLDVEQPQAMVRRHHRHHRQPGAEQQRLHRLLLRSSRQSRREQWRRRDGRVRVRGSGQPDVGRRRRPTACSRRARIST